MKRSEPHPWLVPLYRRILVLAVCVGWVLFELLVGGQSFWLVLALIATGYAAWDFFLSGTYRRVEPGG